MIALTLDAPRHFSIHEVPVPSPGDHDVLLRVASVGICGTDLHIFEGLANYNLDKERRPIPLSRHPQVLGHEFCGRVARSGSSVTRIRTGDRVIVDQVLNCHSRRRSPICEYCATGDSHQCEYGEEYGITGIPGAFAEYLAVPETNVIPVPDELSSESAAMVEPLGCVVHAFDRIEEASTRYTFEGRNRIRTVAILGAGPAGLLFLQYLRKVRRFDGKVLVADKQFARLKLARKFGGQPVDVRSKDLVALIASDTAHLIIEATGAGSVFGQIPLIARRQATLMLYGAGHSHLPDGCLTPLQAMELCVITSAGASGGMADDGSPKTYLRAMELLNSGQIDAESIITHRYRQLADLPAAFEAHNSHEDFIKGMMTGAGA